ncbi:sensor histidine kinase [Modestobacter sp. SYSU DS0511]
MVPDPRPADRLRAVPRALGRAVGGVSPSGPLPWPTRSRRARRLLTAAVALYGLVVALAANSVQIDAGRAAGGLAFLWCLPMVAALVLTLRRPLDGWRLMTLWLLLTPYVLEPPPGPTPLLEPWEWCLWVPVLLAVGWALPRGTAVVVGVLSGFVLLVRRFGTTWEVGPGHLQVSLLALVALLLIGVSMGARWDARRALAEEQVRTEAALAQRGALAERARIAREMHDVVAHELSAIAVRAETAPYRLPDLPPTARTELAAVADTARQALAELQQLLGVLRAEDQAADRAPQPGLSTLTDLVAATRARGVRLEAEVDQPAVPAALGLSAYRIVQQALANAAQHSPGAPVHLRVVAEDGQLRVTVVNGPGDRPGTTGAGVGLVGMRERAELHGGGLTAGPTADGGFAVEATLPLQPAPADVRSP